jgi:hypothetical protein
MNKEEIKEIIFGIGVDSFNRFGAFLDIIPCLKGENYWYALIEACTSSDNLYNYKEAVKKSFLSNQPGSESIMNAAETNYFESLPEKVTIYRGMTEVEARGGDYGCSWTLKKEVAEFFAYKYWRNISTKHLKKVVKELVIDKSEIIAFFNQRQEFEVFYAHKNKLKSRSIKDGVGSRRKNQMALLDD